MSQRVHAGPRWKRVALVGISAVSAFALAGCGGTPDAGGDKEVPETGGTVVAQYAAGPTTFDPALGAAFDDYTTARLMYDTLLRNDEGGTLVGGLATEWEAVSPTEFHFTIRDDATCSDGTAITPTIVADSLTYTAGATSIFEGAESEFVADDAAGTVTLTLASGYAPAPYALAKWNSGIICPAGLDDLEGLAAGTVEGAGTGPYVLADASPGVSYEFALREDYNAWPEFGEPLEGVPADTLRYTIRTDMSTTANQLMSGDINVATVNGDPADRFDNAEGFNIEQISQGNVYIMFNQRDGRIFSELDNRVAAAQAVDREAFNDAFTKGRSVLFDTLVPPGSACTVEGTDHLHAYDPDAAAAVLAGQNVTMIASNAFGDNGSGAEYVSKVLTDAGATVDLQSSDNSTWGSALFTPTADWDITILATTNSGRVADELRRLVGPPIDDGGNNLTGARDNEGFDLLQQSFEIVDPQEQCDVLKEAQLTVIGNAYAIPLAGLTYSVISTDNITVRSFDDYTDPATIRVIG